MSASPSTTNVVALRPVLAPATTADLPEIATKINAAHVAANTAAKAAAEHARIAGASLLQAKTLVTHGTWLTWLDTNCPTIARRTAQAYMQLAEACEKFPDTATDLSAMPVRKAMQLLAETKKPKAQRRCASLLVGEAWAAQQKENAAHAADRCVKQIERAVRSRRARRDADALIVAARHLDATALQALEARLESLQQTIGRLRKKLRPQVANVPSLDGEPT